MNWLSTRTDHLFTGRGRRWDKIRSRSRQLTTSSACGCARRRVARGTRGKKKRAADWKMASGRVGQFPARHTHTRERPIKKKKETSRPSQKAANGVAGAVVFISFFFDSKTHQLGPTHKKMKERSRCCDTAFTSCRPLLRLHLSFFEAKRPKCSTSTSL